MAYLEIEMLTDDFIKSEFYVLQPLHPSPTGWWCMHLAISCPLHSFIKIMVKFFYTSGVLSGVVVMVAHVASVAV